MKIKFIDILLIMLCSSLIIDQDITPLEEFIQSSDKIESLKSFSPNSDSKLYLEGNLLIKSNQSSSNRFQQIFQKLKNNSPDLYERLFYRKLIKELENDDLNIKKRAMTTLKDKLYYYSSLDQATPQKDNSEPDIQIPSSLSDEMLIVDLSDINTNIEGYMKVSRHGKWNLNVKEMTFEVFSEFIKDDESLEFPGVAERIADFLSSGQLKDISMVNQMTIAQLETLRQTFPLITNNNEFIKAMIDKKYSIDSQEADMSVYNKFLNAWNDIKGISGNYGLKSVILYNLLYLGNIVGIMDESILLEYMNFHRFSNIYKDNVRDFNKLFSPFQYLIVENSDEKELLQDYFDKIFKDKDSTSPYDNYIAKELLDEMFALTKIYAGKDPVDFDKLIKQNKLKNLTETSDLEFAKDNPKIFNVDEEVKLNLILRNIPNLTIKILEINTKAYYSKKLTELKPDIELEGLISNEELNYSFKQSPFVRIREEFAFPSLTAKRGTFIIDLIGNGRQSRAMITKGNLKYIIKAKSDGQEFYIIDEKNQPCSSLECGVVIDGKFFQTNKNGYCLIPFASEETTKSIILTDGNMSVFIKEFVHFCEDYKLNVSYMIYEEQLLANNDAKIQIMPSLISNGIKASISLLDEFDIIVTLTNVEGLKSSKTYKHVLIKEVITVSLQVPFKISQIDISISAILKHNSNIQLKDTFTKNLHSFLYDSLSSIYLKADIDQGFILEFRGKDGEIWKDQVIDLNVNIYDTSKQVRLISNNEGKIYLGNLENVLSISTYYMNTNYFWNMNNYLPTINYPTKININEGDDLELPFYVATENPRFNKNNSLFRINTNNLIEENCSKNIQYNIDESMLKLKGLKSGVYMLKLRTTNAIITIEVVNGIIFSEKSCIATGQKALPYNKHISGVGFNKIIFKNSILNIEFSGNSEGAKVHALFCNYLSNSISEIYNELLKQKESYFTEIRYTKEKNSYLKSRRLNEEYRYVLDRKGQPKYPGNNLSRPQLLLKRKMVQNTDTEIQEVYGGEAFPAMASGSFMNRKSFQTEESLLLMMNNGLSNSLFLDFLDYPSIWKFAVVSKDESVTFNIEGHYSQVILIVSNGDYSSMKIVPLESSQTKTKTLVSSAKLGNTSLYSEQIKISILHEGDSLNLNNQDLSSLEIIDSIEKLMQVQLDISGIEEYNEWNFLSK